MMSFYCLEKCEVKSVYSEWPGSKRLLLQVLLDSTDEVPHPIMSAIEQIIVQFISRGRNNHLLPLHNAEWPVKRKSKLRNDIIKLNHITQLEKKNTILPPRQLKVTLFPTHKSPNSLTASVCFATISAPRNGGVILKRRVYHRLHCGAVFAFPFQAVKLKAGGAGVTINDLIFRNMFAISVLNALSRLLWKTNPSWLIAHVIRISGITLNNFFLFFFTRRGFCHPQLQKQESSLNSAIFFLLLLEAF